MASGLGKLITTASDAEMKEALLQFGKVDPIRELGLDLEIAQYNTRLEALTDPKVYAGKRQAAFDDMVIQIRKSYEDAYKGFIGAGMGTDMAKSFALQAANNEKITRRQVIETQFPTNANMIGEQATIRNTKTSVANFKGGPAPRRRAAPRAKRAPARRRR